MEQVSVNFMAAVTICSGLSLLLFLLFPHLFGFLLRVSLDWDQGVFMAAILIWMEPGVVFLAPCLLAKFIFEVPAPCWLSAGGFELWEASYFSLPGDFSIFKPEKHDKFLCFKFATNQTLNFLSLKSLYD